MDNERKEVQWVGRSYDELQDFPRAVVRIVGFNLKLVQEGDEPEDWKPMESVGPGAREIRVRTNEGGAIQHRVIYVAKFHEAIYVLHAFEKKRQTTSQHNLQVARARYSQMLRERQSCSKAAQGG